VEFDQLSSEQAHAIALLERHIRDDVDERHERQQRTNLGRVDVLAARHRPALPFRRPIRQKITDPRIFRVVWRQYPVFLGWSRFFEHGRLGFLVFLGIYRDAFKMLAPSRGLLFAFSGKAAAEIGRDATINCNGIKTSAGTPTRRTAWPAADRQLRLDNSSPVSLGKPFGCR
jgi:hypothetical protein